MSRRSSSLQAGAVRQATTTEGSADDPDLGRKRFRDGTHRTLFPESTLARVLPLAPRIGLTRLAVLTGLDRIGIPVVAAYRPNSRSIAVHQGKGTSLAAAKASALMEALETDHAENLTLPLRFATFEEMASVAPATDPDTLPRAWRAGPITDRLLWVEGRDLATGGPLWVPHELVSADYTAGAADGRSRFQATTNGLASGNHWLEAALHGLCEVVERDALALWHALPEAAQQSRAVDPATINGLVSAPLLPLFDRAGIAIRVWDVTSDIGLPAYLCLAASADHADRVQPEFGSGCHPNRDIALARALTEAAQARLTVISGARDDIAIAGHTTDRVDRQQAAARRLLQGPAGRSFRAT